MSSTGINESVIRWSEIRLPDPSKAGELVSWKVDGPFALRSFYRVPGSRDVIPLDLTHRQPDGTIHTCLHCGGTPLEKSMDVPWGPILGLAVLGLGLGWFTYGLTALLALYPIWFLWSSGPRTQKCHACKAEFIDFRFGPRP